MPPVRLELTSLPRLALAEPSGAGFELAGDLSEALVADSNIVTGGGGSGAEVRLL